MLKESYPYYLANRAEAPNADLEVIDKYTGAVATRVALADANGIELGDETANGSLGVSAQEDVTQAAGSTGCPHCCPCCKPPMPSAPKLHRCRRNARSDT